MGGSTTTVTPNVQQTAEPNYGNIPGYSSLAGAGLRQMDANAANTYNTPQQLLPNAQLGQVQMAGPNATLIGNPEGTSAMQGSFGQVGNYKAPYSQTGGQSVGGKGNAVPGRGQNNAAVTGSTNTAASDTGNSSLSSVANSLAGLDSSGAMANGALQGLQGTSPAGFGQAAQALAGTQAPYKNMGSQTMGGKGGQPSGQQGQAQQASPVNPTTGTADSESPFSDKQVASASPSAAATTNGSYDISGSPLPDSSRINPGQVLPNSAAGDNPVLAANPQVSQATQNSFMGANMTSPYYNEAAVAGNVGTAYGGAVQPAANFATSLFSPGLSQMSQDYLQAGAANAGTNLQQGIGALQSQYENDPFNGALGRSEANLISQTANNTLQTASGMGVQQQQIAANQMSTPANITEQSAAVPVKDAQGLYNTSLSAYKSPYELATNVLAQTPISSPAVGSTTTSNSTLG